MEAEALYEIGESSDALGRSIEPLAYRVGRKLPRFTHGGDGCTELALHRR